MYTVGTAGFADKREPDSLYEVALVLAVVVMGLGVFLKKHYVLEEQSEE